HRFPYTTLFRSSRPVSTRVPPFVQLPPSGSAEVDTRAVRPLVPLVPSLPSLPLVPSLPAAPSQTYVVASISPASSVELSLSSRPVSTRVPPFVQLPPSGSAEVDTRAVRPLVPSPPSLPSSPSSP